MQNNYSFLAYKTLNKIHRSKHRQMIIAILSVFGPMTREKIHKKTGLPEKTVCGRVNDLIKFGVVSVVGEGETLCGRKAEVIGLGGIV